MLGYTKEQINKIVKDQNVKFIRLQFTDIFGKLKNITITPSQLNRALDNKIMFDGSSIEGFARIEESDMMLCPDLNTFVIFPWTASKGKTARLICDVKTTKGKPFDGDPRYCLKKVLKKAEDIGYKFKVGTELEFFLFHLDEYGHPTTISHDRSSYFDMGPADKGECCRRDICLALEQMNFEVEASHHEVAPAQHEIDFKYSDAMDTADNIMTFKLVVQTIAKEHNLCATFMPKPIFGVCGSGMHVNMSLFKNECNVFYDEASPDGLSEIAKYFIGGLMKHAKGMTALTNPIVNSYKRLVPGYEAPIYIAWSSANRSPLIRVPAVRNKNTRIELRSPDPSSNPYLVEAACLSAGLDGIANKISPPKSVSANLYDLSKTELKKQKVKTLPDNLFDAIKELKKDETICSTLGDHIYNCYSRAKMSEWERYRIRVSQWEIDEYLRNY